MKLNNGLRVLCYHSISCHKGTALDYIRVELETFKKQINWLLNNGWKSISINEYIKLVENNDKNKNNKWFTVTFDDGFIDNRDAIDWLNSKGVHNYTFYTNTTSRFNEWDTKLFENEDDRMEVVKYSDMLDYKNEFTGKTEFIGYHTSNHKDLTKLHASGSIYLECGSNSDSLCIPFGRYDNYVLDRISRIYKYVYTMDDGVFRGNKSTYDNYIISRIQVTGTRGMMDFIWKVKLGFNLRYRLKKLFKFKSLYKLG